MPNEGIHDEAAGGGGGGVGHTLGSDQGGRAPRLTAPTRPHPRPGGGSGHPALSLSAGPRHTLTSREPVTDVL